MPGVFIGSTELTTVGDIKIGATDVQEVYVGATKVFPTGAVLTPIFDWNAETAQALPGTSTFTRASVAQVLTTTDGTTNWYQEAKSGEVPLDGLRRVENFLTTWDFTDAAWIKTTTGGAAITITNNFAESPIGSGTTATRFEMSTSGAGFNNCLINQDKTGVPDTTPHTLSVWLKLNTGTSDTIILQTFDLAGGTNPDQNSTLTVTDTWQRFALETALVELNIMRFSLNFSSGSADSIDLLVAVDEGYGPMMEIVQSGNELPSEPLNPGTEYLNIGVDAVSYFKTTNGNSVNTGTGVVTEAAGTTITGGRYLPEPAATKRLLHSNDLTNAAWVAQGAVVPTDLGVTDIGGQSTQIAGLGALGVDDISQSVAGFTASGSIAPSFLLQRVSATGTLRIVNAAGGAVNGEWQVDLSLIGSGWVRLEPGANVTGFSEVTPWVADGAGNGGITYHAAAGGPLTVNLAFNNGEDTAFSTSPIITSGSTVTRVADSLTDVDWPATASAVIDTTVNNVIPGGTIDNQQNMLGFGSNSAHSFVLSAPAVARIFTGGINSFITASSSYESERHGFGMSFQVNEGIVVDDEDNDNTDVTGTPGGGTIQIGLNSGLVGVPGKYHRIRIYDQTQSVEELKAEV